MEISQFIKKFAEQFEETDISEFEANTAFKDLDEWSSLTALSIIAMVDDEYGVKITGDDIRKTTQIQDIFDLVDQRKK